MSVFFISELLATSIFGNENSSLEQLMKSTGFQNPNLRLSCLLPSSLTTTQLWGYVLFLRMSCIKHNFGTKKGRSTGKMDRIRPGKALGRPAEAPLASARAPKIQGATLEICVSMFYRKCPMKKVRKREGKFGRKKEKKKIRRRREEKNKWRDSMVR